MIALPYAMCSEALLSYFGRDTERFIVIHDDCHQLTETEIWGTVLSLSHRDKCEGIIMATDVKEWPLGIATLAPLEQKCTLKVHRHYQEGFSWMYSTWYKCRDENRPKPGPFRTKGTCQLKWHGGTNECKRSLSCKEHQELFRSATARPLAHV